MSPQNARPLRFLVGQKADHEWLAMEALAQHGGFPSGSAARQWVRRMAQRHGLPFAKRGRRIFVDKAVYDRFILDAGRRSA